MSTVRFIGCLHLGHETVAKYRGFLDSYNHDEYLRHNWNKTVNKRDLTFILGDITMENHKHYHQLDALNGRKIVVLGNHDRHQDVRQLLLHVESVAGAIDYKGFCLTHIPVHPNEIGRYRGNIHAHIHHNSLEELIVSKIYKESDERIETKRKYYHVDAFMIDFKPKTIEELLNGRT